MVPRRATNDGAKRVEVSVSPARGNQISGRGLHTQDKRSDDWSWERANTVGMDSAEDKRVLCAAG